VVGLRGMLPAPTTGTLLGVLVANEELGGRPMDI